MPHGPSQPLHSCVEVEVERSRDRAGEVGVRHVLGGD
jgi:hypothetical protein